MLAVYVTRRAVEREIILVSVFLSVDIDNSLFFVYSYSAATRYTASAHTAGNNRRVRSHTASYGQYALSCVHTFDILRGSLKSYENNLFAVFSSLYSFFGSKANLTASCTGRCGQALCDNLCFLQSLGFELRVEQGVELLGLNLEQSLFLGNHTFPNEVASNLDSCASGTLTVSRLEHIKSAFFDGKLHILHILVSLFESVCDFYELVIYCLVGLSKLVDSLRSTDTRNYVLALSVHKILAVEFLLTRRRVSGESNARTGSVSHITEYH